MNNDNSNVDDYYAFLNVPKDATGEHIRNSYKLLSRRFHPDKHSDPALKRQAALMFDKLKKVYDVLSDPNKRTIYDTLGPSGLDGDSWALVERKYKSAQEIKEEFDKLLKEKEERIMQQRTNPKGSVVVIVNATELFETEEDPYADEEEDSRWPSIEIVSMSISQSIEAPLTVTNNAILSGNISVRNGVGSGTISTSVRHIFSPTTYGEVELGAGQGPMVALKGSRVLTSDIHLYCQTAVHATPFGIGAGFTTYLTRQFNKNLIGYLAYKTGSQSSMSTVAVYDNEFCRVNASISFGIRNSYISTSYTHKFKENDTKVKLGVKFTLLGSMLEYGCETRISKHSILGAAMSVSNSSGVSLRVKLIRNNQNYIFPILLSEEVIPVSIFYGSVVPLFAYYLVKSFIVDPYLKQKQSEDGEQRREESSLFLHQKRNEAKSYIELMKETYERIVEREVANAGLVIERAIYGAEHVVAEYASNIEPIPDFVDAFDFKVALQVMITDQSTLCLSPTSKSYLPGFFDPYIGGTKKLLIRYRHRGTQHQVLLDELDSVSLPSE